MDRLSDYDYVLPEELIAQTPLECRSDSRLLHVDRETGNHRHRMFRDIVDLLRAGDLLVMNETRVSAVRLFGRKRTGGVVEALLMRELAPGVFDALLKPGRRLAPGVEIAFGDALVARVLEGVADGPRRLEFEMTPDLNERIQAVAEAPLPPYIHARLADRERYQTVYGRTAGSAAAPTAGLHFTGEILDCLRSQGVRTATVTLHVGLDTFRPVQVDDPSLHPIHGEECSVPPETATAIAETASDARIVAVGTTTVRSLETFAVGRRRVEPGKRCSRLFIRPGFRFRVTDGMFTNFHMPRTTMMMMISAMAGREAVMGAYAAAVANHYRFLSFGDSMLIL